jgi:mono/diheme cytochrome c family protein
VSWSPAFPEPLPATAVLALADGSVLAFVVSRGLLRSDPTGTGWNEVDDRFGEQVLVDLAAHPASPTHLYGLNQFGRVISSVDGGATWLPFARTSETRDPAALRGKALYETHCAACHGTRGVGENWTSTALRDRAYIRAPALDDSTHAWHHTDAALTQTILEGSPREPRMRAWREVLSERDAEEIVAYVKSLWGPRALDCQGPKHMQCM